MAVQYNLVGFEDQQNITVVLDGEMYVANNDNANWNKIIQLVMSGVTEGLADLFSPEKAVSNNFSAITERVSVRNGQVLFDGDAVDNSLTRQVLRFLEEGVDDWKPLVAFMARRITLEGSAYF